MRKGRLLLALSLVIPLGVYFVPYAYAAQTVTTYSVHSPPDTIKAHNTAFYDVKCLGSSDYSAAFPALSTVQGPAVTLDSKPGLSIYSLAPLNSAGAPAADGQTVNGWEVFVANTNSFDLISTRGLVIILCTNPVTVAGIGVPEFGQLYTAIALGAVVFFMLSRRASRTPPSLASSAG